MTATKRDRSASTRRRRLKAHPLCAECAKAGIVRSTDIIDHVQPLAFGGAESDENVQGLCFVHDAIKTAGESSSAGGVSNHPEWLGRASGRLVIVCGPPCSGKSTFVAEQSKPGDLVIDLDDLVARIAPGSSAWTGLEPDVLNRAIRVRNALLGSLSNKGAPDAWFVVSAPSPDERAWWQARLGGEVVVLGDKRSAIPLLERRARERGTPAAIAGIHSWFERAGFRWSPKPQRQARVAFGVDGFPLKESE